MTVFYKKHPSSELAHLAWCILIATRMAIREGRTQPGLQQHLFIMQWLATAKKQKRFPKSVAEDIEWLIQQGKRYGFGANLYQKVEYIYRSSIGELAKQSPLFRFTYFIETLKISGWLDFYSLQKTGVNITGHQILPVRSTPQKLSYISPSVTVVK